MSSITAAQLIGIATAFVAAGGIASLSVMDVPVLQSQPASRSLPQIKWIFSRGSHIYPSAGVLASASFVYLAYNHIPKTSAISDISKVFLGGGKSSMYLAAAALCMGIAPVTSIMVPTNFKLMDINTEKGGYRSAESAKVAQKKGANSADDTVNGERNTGELTDLSGPQSKTMQDSTPQEDREARELLQKFGLLNYGRAALMASGGLLALLAAVTP